MATSPYTVYSGSSLIGLVDSFLGQNSGIAIDAQSITLTASAADAVNIYDGSLSPLGIGSGLLLTSGTTPGTANTVQWFGQDNTVYAPDGTSTNFYNGDKDIDAVVNTVFQTQSYDATSLSFAFSVTDPTATSISFDLVFGTDEYPEWVDQFVDCAVVIVNGVNYAFFNHDPNAPLSVISPNLAAGYFQDNAGNVLPIEYDGVSHVLKIIAPIIPGQVNTIKIGVADTGDHIYDSGLFISNMVAGNTPGSGVVITPDVPCTNGNDIVSGTVADELITLLGGDDAAYAGGGDDIVVAGAGNDTVYGGSGNDVLQGDDGNDYLDGGEGSANVAVYAGQSGDYAFSYDSAFAKYTLGGAEGTDTLVNVQLAKFADGLFDLTAGGLVAHSGGSGTPANTPGSLVVTGASVVGQTLSALVIDADGLPANGGSIVYSWLTSANGGLTWVETGTTAKTYVVAAADAGHQIMATASYTDQAGHAEAPASAALTVAAPTGDPLISLMQISAPAGASVMNPLTTLLDKALALGFSANDASMAIKAVLGLPDINLKSYDPLAALNSDPADALALQVMKICGEVAMAASVSDPTGFNLTLSVMDAAQHGLTLNLANADVLAALLPGIGAIELDIVQTTNKDMADAPDFGRVMAAWNDFCGHLDAMETYQNNLGVLSVHLNLAPVGTSTASLPFGLQDTAYTINGADLLAGFSDPDGNPLQVIALSTDTPGVIADNGDGTWTFMPDSGFSGPVELGFTLSDPSGASVNGSTLLVIASAMPQDTTPPSAVITSDMSGTVNGDVSFSVAFSEDVFGLAASSFTVTNGTVTGVSGLGASYTVVVTPDAGFEGSVGITLDSSAVTDAAGNPNEPPASASQAVDTLAPTVAAFAPVDGATGVETGANIIVTFSETVSLGTGNIEIRQGSPAGALVESFDVGTSTRLGVTGASLTIDPTDPLQEGTQYYVVLAAGAVSDGAGNGFVGTSAYDFTTVAPIALNLTGTAGADILAGGSLDDVLNGLAGIDSMDGREGSDLYLLASASEHAAAEIHDSGQSGIDEVRFTASSAGTLKLFAGDTGIEKIVIGTGSGPVADSTSTTALSVNASAVLNGLTLVGNAGANTLVGSAFDDILMGGLGNDLLNGGLGSDTVSYQDVAAAVSVNLGVTKAQNTLGAGTDTLQSIENLIGGAGNDNLTGSGSANWIEGGAGADTITGGGGADQFRGGSGGDCFVFKTLSNSAVSAPDTIWDFNGAEGDRIDLSIIDAIAGGKNQAFTFAAAFTHKAGQLIAVQSGDHYLVQGDVNGDGLADFAIAVHSGAPLQSGDFLL